MNKSFLKEIKLQIILIIHFVLFVISTVRRNPFPVRFLKFLSSFGMTRFTFLKSFIIIAVVLIPTEGMFAQQTLDSMMVISTGEYKPSVTDANKMSEKPSVVDSTKKLPVAPFGISSSPCYHGCN